MPRTKRGIRRCIVVGCGSTDPQHFQLFPRTRKLKKAWIKLANVRDRETNTLINPCNLDYVCRRHFLDGVPVPTQDLGYPGSDYRLYNPAATVHEILEQVCKEFGMKIPIPLVSVTSMAATPRGGQIDVQLIRTTTGLSGATETTTGKIGFKLVKTATSNDPEGSTMPTARRIDIKLVKPAASVASGPTTASQIGSQRIKTPISIAPGPAAAQIRVPLIHPRARVASGPTATTSIQSGIIKLFKPLPSGASGPAMTPAGQIKVIKSPTSIARTPTSVTPTSPIRVPPPTLVASGPTATPSGQTGVIKLFKPPTSVASGPEMAPAGQIDIEIIKTPTSGAIGPTMATAGQTETGVIKLFKPSTTVCSGTTMAPAGQIDIKLLKTPAIAASGTIMPAGIVGAQLIKTEPGHQDYCDRLPNTKRKLPTSDYSNSILSLDSEIECNSKRKRSNDVEKRVRRIKQEVELLDGEVPAKDQDQDVFAPLMMS